MKRVLLSAFLVLAMTFPLVTPAQAIFGLSTCEKVKKQVHSYEEQIDARSTYWSKYLNKTIPRSLVPLFDKQRSPENDLLVKLNKLQYNNPQCFTRTQNEQIIARKKNWDFNDFVEFDRNTVLRQTKECQTIWEKMSPSAECLIRYEYKITETFTIPSIYQS